MTEHGDGVEAACLRRVVPSELHVAFDGGEDRATAFFFQVRHGLLEVLHGLAVVAQHDEHAHLDAMLPEQPRHVARALRAGAAAHAVEDALRAALRPEPDPVTTHGRQRLDDLPVEIRQGRGGKKRLSFEVGTPLKDIEREMIVETLRSVGGDKGLAASLLGITARTIYRREAEWSDGE